MQAFEIRSFTDDDIKTRLEEAYEELFNLRFQLAIGQVRDSNRISVVKRDIAKLKTVQKERELVA